MSRNSHSICRQRLVILCRAIHSKKLQVFDNF
jgi:hypothetical protein